MKQFKLIIDERGKEILNDRIALEEAMRQKGCDERDIHTVLLILAACPVVAGQLIKQEPTAHDVRIMVNTCCVKTGLHVRAVRRGIGMLLYGCGYSSTCAPRLTVWRIKGKLVDAVPETPEEDQTVSVLEARLRQNAHDAGALSDLHNLAEAGNQRAAYALGCFFKRSDDMEGTQTGLPYFQKAAQNGFGPANGALASYYINGSKKDLAKAAKCFNNPSSLYGKEGREWKSLAWSLMQYRKDNRKRLGVAVAWQIGVLVASAVLVGLPSFGWGPIICLVAQALALLWTILCWIFRPYQSCRIGYYTMLISWLLLAICIL